MRRKVGAGSRARARRASRAPTWRSSAAASPAARPRTSCASAGARVVLIEAARIGRGSTAASTALLMQEPDVDFGDLRGRYGASGARQVWEASRLAVRSLIRHVAAAARCAAGRGASVDLLHAARGTGGRAEEGTGGATSGRDCRRVADADGTTATGGFRRSRRDPHAAATRRSIRTPPVWLLLAPPSGPAHSCTNTRKRASSGSAAAASR